MSQLFADRNLVGRVGAALCLGLAAFGVHRLSCGTEMCPVMKTDSCCAGAAGHPAAAAPTAPAKAAKAKPAKAERSVADVVRPAGESGVEGEQEQRRAQ